MNSRKCIHFRLIFVLAVVGLTMWIVFSNQDLPSVLNVLSSLDHRWILAAFGCWFGCVFTEAIWFACYMPHQGYTVSFPYG